jgi:hypothetical protein
MTNGDGLALMARRFHQRPIRLLLRSDVHGNFRARGG